MRRQHAVGAIALAEDDRDEWREGLFQPEDDRERVRRVYAPDDVVAVARDHVVVGIQDRFVAEAHVAAGERHAVVPADVATQVIGDRQPVGTDAAVGLRGHLAREIRHELAMLVGGDQDRGGQARCDALEGLRCENGIERPRQTGHGDAQFAGPAPGRGGARGAPASCRAARCEGTGARDEQKGPRAPREVP